MLPNSSAALATDAGYTAVGADSSGDLRWEKPNGNSVSIVAAGDYALTIPATGTAALISTTSWVPALAFGGAWTLGGVLRLRHADRITLLFAGALPYGLQLTGISRDTATEGEAAVGRITLQLSTLFHVAPAAPETIL